MGGGGREWIRSGLDRGKIVEALDWGDGIPMKMRRVAASRRDKSLDFRVFPE